MKYIAELVGVREVTLVGTAELAPWKAALECVGLTPFAPEGRAEISLSAADAVWKWKRFREVALGVSVSRRPSGDSHDGYYLACAFHSSRLFGWFERTCFKAPHVHAIIDVRDEIPAAVDIRNDGGFIIRASMGEARAPLREAMSGWDLPIFLPNRGGTRRSTRNLFHGRVRGMTRVFPYLSDRDFFSVGDTSVDCGTAILKSSGFVGVEWQVRSNAEHARSKTVSEPKAVEQGGA